MKTFNDLTEREILALAISLEEEDERVYADFAEGLRQEFPASGAVFESMRKGRVGTPPSAHRALSAEIR
jgi:erythrin-vacuolar iron transport family protein